MISQQVVDGTARPLYTAVACGQRKRREDNVAKGQLRSFDARAQI